MHAKKSVVRVERVVHASSQAAKTRTGWFIADAHHAMETAGPTVFFLHLVGAVTKASEGKRLLSCSIQTAAFILKSKSWRHIDIDVGFLVCSLCDIMSLNKSFTNMLQSRMGEITRNSGQVNSRSSSSSSNSTQQKSTSREANQTEKRRHILNTSTVERLTNITAQDHVLNHCFLVVLTRCANNDISNDSIERLVFTMINLDAQKMRKHLESILHNR